MMKSLAGAGGMTGSPGGVAISAAAGAVWLSRLLSMRALQNVQKIDESGIS
jgi:hypothetical protein